MSRRFYSAAASFALAFSGVAPATAYVKPSLKQTFGSHRYRGTSAAVDFGSGSWHIRPAYSNFSSESSSGTFHSGSLRVAYDYDRYQVGVSGGWTPRVADYKSRFVGGDVMASYDFDEDKDQGKSGGKKRKALSHLDAGVGLTSTIHNQAISFPAIAAGVFSVPATTTTLDIHQFDVEGNLAATLLDYTFSLAVTKSVYDRDLARLSTRVAPVARLAGLNSTLQGFPSLSINTRVDFDAVPVIKPYLSYTYTSFKVTQPNSAAYSLGAMADIGDLGYLLVSYERYSQRGGSDINYYTFGGTLKF